MSHVINSPLALCLALLTAWCVVGVAGLVRPMSIAFVGRTLFPLGALCGAALAVVAVASLDQPTEQLILPIGLPDLPAHLRLDALSRVFLLLLGARIRRHFDIRGGLLSPGRGHSAGIAVRAVSFVSRRHGLRPARRRRLRVHAGMGDHGAGVLLSGDHAASHSRDTQSRISIPADGPCRRDRHSAVLRHSAGRQLAIHLRRHACRASRPAVGLACVFVSH